MPSSGLDEVYVARRRSGDAISTSVRGEEVGGFVVDDRTGPSDEPVKAGGYRGAVVLDQCTRDVIRNTELHWFAGDLASLYPSAAARHDESYRELNERVAAEVARRLPPI